MHQVHHKRSHIISDIYKNIKVSIEKKGLRKKSGKPF